MTSVIEHISVGLLHRMRYQLVPDNPPVNKKVLKVRLAAGERGKTYPALQFELGQFALYVNRLLHKGWATERRHPPLLLRLVQCRP